MNRLLDPRSDLVFRRIFGEHPEILRDFLNSVLPLDSPIARLEYQQADQMPILPVFKRGIVDVKCEDENGRLFLVEMQMQWTNAFLQRVLFNASQAYVKQLETGETFEFLQPVMALSILNDTYIKDSPEYFHHYKIIHTEQPSQRIEGLEFVFIELPKFRERNPTEARRVRWAWLNFLRAAGQAGREGYQDVASFVQETAITPSIQKAIELAQQQNFTHAEQRTYERFWQTVSMERTLMSGKYKDGKAVGFEEGHAEGLLEGHADGLAEGEARGILKARAAILSKLLASGLGQAEAEAMLDPLD